MKIYDTHLLSFTDIFSVIISLSLRENMDYIITPRLVSNFAVGKLTSTQYLTHLLPKKEWCMVTITSLSKMTKGSSTVKLIHCSSGSEKLYDQAANRDLR